MLDEPEDRLRVTLEDAPGGLLEGGVRLPERRVPKFEGGVRLLEGGVRLLEGGVPLLERRVPVLEGGMPPAQGLRVLLQRSEPCQEVIQDITRRRLFFQDRPDEPIPRPTDAPASRLAQASLS